MWGSRDPILEFLGPPNISRTVEARNFKFCMETDGGEFLRKKIQNWVKKGHVLVTGPNFGIFGPPNISRTFKAKKFKFGMETEGAEF